MSDATHPSDDQPITAWVRSLRQSDQTAAYELWSSFRERLESLAKRELARLPRPHPFDEEDVALSAFYALCTQIQGGGFSKLANRRELWWLSILMTKRKAGDRIKHEMAEKRSSKDVRIGLSSGGIDQLAFDAPTPHQWVEMREQCERLLAILDDDELRFIAIWKLEGNTNDEIAERLNRTRQTVQRKLNLIRSIWSRELTADSSDAGSTEQDK
jgi:DNA-directed RNA polymerase specialized sigma24 family protein